MLGLLLQGKSNKLIARELNLSVETVKDHVAAVLRALGVSSRTQAVLAVSQMPSQGARRAMALASDRAERGGAARRRRRSGRGRAGARGVRVDSTLLLRDHVRGTFAYNRTSLAGHAVGAIVVELVFAGVAPRALLVAWGAGFAHRLAARAVAGRAFRARRADDGRRAAPRLRTWHAGVLASGALWGVAAWLFSAYGSGLHQLALVLVVYTFCVACVPILAPQFRAVRRLRPPGLRAGDRAVARAATRRSSWELATRDDGGDGNDHPARAQLPRIVRQHRRPEAAHRGAGGQLRAEKAVADAARREAEAANRAKTQFFAAASHDLRQPLHAMGLFAEALRQRSHDPEVAQLVNSINESVDALEGLFSELLDITRIDSGGVEVHPADFELADIFRKVRLHFEPAAFEKGLALRVRGDQRVAFADPLLVERILRNLVSNAIRYTERRLGARQLPAGAAIGCCCRSGTPARASAPRQRGAHLRGVLPGAGNARARRASRRRASASAWRSSSASPI